MKTRRIITGVLLFISLMAYAQEQEPFDGRPEQGAVKSANIEKKIKVWRLSEGYSFSDTLPIDTMLNGFQRNNPVMQSNPFMLHTGNVGAPSQSMILEHIDYEHDFIFTNALRHYFPLPSRYLFYNTTVPYTNITYRTGGPKRRSEENISVLFTQNVNRKTNIGVSYNLMSSIGRYDAQRADNEMVRFWGSYNGELYSGWGTLAMNQTTQNENGGVANEQSILRPTPSDFQNSENVGVNFSTAQNKIKNFRLFYTHALNLGQISSTDSLSAPSKLGIGTIIHTAELDRYKRVYSIDDLATYYSGGIANAYYKNIYTDTLRTRDTSTYSVIRNTVQLRYNEEANPFLRFGMRVYLENEIKTYQAQAEPFKYTVNNQIWIPHYRFEKINRSSTAIGGQLFKNLGDNFWWNAGTKLYIQGYRVGDSEITGRMNSQFRVGRDTAGIFASGGLYLQTPGLFFDDFYSNHFAWNHDFKREKTLKVKGGLRIPTKRFEVAGELRLINDHLHWNQQALPDQTGGVLQAVSVNINQHFKIWGINSANQIWWQATSNSEAMPLPLLAAYSSNYYENIAFQVLRFQVGFDLKYHTKYYAPTYMPATMQFYNQREREIGEYPFVDVFVNFHLKRARIGIKMEHINQGYPNYDYFITQGYPANPRSLKVSVSWNFYD
jgi:hypothetical protein